MDSITGKLDAAVKDGKLLESSRKNIADLLGGSTNPVYHASVEELVETGEWSELNDRFFKRLAFGTSGLRGRTIGRIITKAEAGVTQAQDRPEFPCTGTNAMNFYNLSRATVGFVTYLKQWLGKQGINEKPHLIFCHDTRYFRRDFAEFCAGICTDLGCDVSLWESHRPTPELSFAIRKLKAHGGVMLTASHNPPHDNGYKVYFRDGAGIDGETATGILNIVNSLTSDQYTAVPESERGQMHTLGEEIDNAYTTRLKDLLLAPAILEKGASLKIIFSALHGTGGVFCPSLLRDLGFQCLTVAEQDEPDGRFPTVESPNPENAPALKMGMDLAEKEGADIVIATDPDCDRMGVAVRNKDGKLVLITGNQIGSLMAWYRIDTFFKQGVITDANREHAVLLKTFVTTGLQNAIADAYGIRCTDTLTGFKYIGQKLLKYEQALPREIQANYSDLTEQEIRDVQLSQGSFFVFGGEESYGYLGSEFVRDKDANGAVIMFAELAAYAKSRDMTIVELLDEIYARFGYFLEVGRSLEFAGAEGAAKIQKLVSSYASHPPAEADGASTTSMRNFASDDIYDAEGDLIPKENMMFFDLEDGRTFACRPSGTEPKMKYYIFGNRRPKGDPFTPEELAEAKEHVDKGLDSLWEWVRADIDARLNA
ncbi:MAG: phospho-sugar mutase [Verrucomicrobiae bacterium]|nr:phospho-sugar mutase [Verrucomicrobiae bacterium]